MEKIKVIARNSKLSLLQVEEVFQHYKNIAYELQDIESWGDQHKEVSLLDGEAPADIFTRELDNALIEGRADISIHSAKDLAYPLPSGIEVIALLPPFDQTDSLVSNNRLTLEQLPAGAIVGTSSPLRKQELLSLRPDLIVEGIRGTIEERIAQVEHGKYDAAIVATCALKRLGLEHKIAQILPFATHPLQGYIAITAAEGRHDLKQLFIGKDVLHRQGKVCLVGFGPGNPDLLTIAGERELKRADVIYYDDLTNKAFLSHYKAEKVYVGKRSGKHSHEQNDINAKLLQSARNGNYTIRLKGGDPSIFAHTNEEVEYLQRNLVKVNIIPGITAASAMAASANIGLTHRGIASSVAFVSGHNKDILTPNADTLVYYMGMSNLKPIASKLIAEGRPAETPMLLLSNVSLANEQCFKTTIGEMAASPKKDFPTPLIALVGNVAQFHQEPKGRVLVTGTDAKPYLHLGTIVHTPLIEISSANNQQELANEIEQLKRYNYLLFTSRYAVHYFFTKLISMGFDNRELNGLKIISIGSTTSNELKEIGIKADLEATDNTSEGVVELFQKLKAETGKTGSVLLPRSNIALPIIPEGLGNLGYQVKCVSAYENHFPANPQKVDLSTIDTIVFSSPSCIDGFLKLYGALPKGKNIVCRGSTTQNHLRQIQANNK